MTNQPFFFPALFIGLAALPLVLALVPRNRRYGFRSTKTLADDRLWYAANRLGGWTMLLASSVYLAFAAACPTTGLGDRRFGMWLAHFAAFAVPLAGALVLTMRAVRRL